MQGVAYSSNQTDTNVVVLALFWGAFIFAGMIAMYYLGHALWLNKSDQATSSPSRTASSVDTEQSDVSGTGTAT